MKRSIDICTEIVCSLGLVDRRLRYTGDGYFYFFVTLAHIELCIADARHKKFRVLFELLIHSAAMQERHAMRRGEHTHDRI